MALLRAGWTETGRGYEECSFYRDGLCFYRDVSDCSAKLTGACMEWIGQDREWTKDGFVRTVNDGDRNL